MTVLTDLSVEVLEVITSMLVERHLARLLMTGDMGLRKKLSLLRQARFDLSTRETADSELVKSFVIANAREAIVSTAHISLAGDIKYGKLTRLVITNDLSSLFFAKRVDLSSMTALQSLKIGQSVNLTVGIKLPPSITSAVLRSVECYCPIENLREMTSLTHLTLKTTTGNLGPILSDWPTSLTSLKLVLRGAGAGLVDTAYYKSLPARLRHLHLGIFVDLPVVHTPRLDLSPLCEHLTELESLHLECTVVSTVLSRPLPPTITSLTVRAPLANGLSEFMSNILPTVTKMRIDACQPDEINFCETLGQLLPRMELVNFERSYASVFNRIDPSVYDVFTRVLTSKFGLPAAYLDFVADNGGAWSCSRPRLTLQRIVLLMEVGLTREQTDTVLANKRIDYEAVRDLSYVTEVYVKHCFTLLEWRLVDQLHLVVGIVGLLQSLNWQLPPATINGIRHLTMDICHHQQLICLLEKNALASVGSMHVKRKFGGPLTLSLLWDVIANHRDKLPRLECITWAITFDDLTPKDLSRMANLCFYPTGNDSAVYRVAPPAKAPQTP